MHHRPAGVDELPLLGVDPRVLGGTVAHVPPPAGREQERSRGGEEEGVPPSETKGQPGDQRTGGRGPESRPGVLERVRQRPARHREPVAGRPAPDDREQRRLDHPHEKAKGHEGEKQRGRGECSGGPRNEPDQQVRHAPECGQRRQGAPGTDQVAHHAARELEEGVAPGEPAQHQAQLNVRQPELGGHRGASYGHVAAEEVGDEAPHGHQRTDPPSNGGRACGGGGGRVRVHARSSCRS